MSDAGSTSPSPTTGEVATTSLPGGAGTTEEHYQKRPEPRDPNMPINPEDPNDKLRAEGPEVGDPATAVAHALYRVAKPIADEALASDTPNEGEEAAAAADAAVAETNAAANVFVEPSAPEGETPPADAAPTEDIPTEP